MEANGCCPEVGGTELVLVGSPWEGEAPAEPANPWEGEVTDQREFRTPEEGGQGDVASFQAELGFCRKWPRFRDQARTTTILKLRPGDTAANS